MNAEVFKRWLAYTLISNLPKGSKVFTVIDNVKYHSRLAEKSPTMNMRKNNMISYLIKHRIKVTSPLSAKPALLQKICETDIPDKYVVEKMALDA